MSSKYNRFLLSACLPAMAVAVFLPTPAFAGFEWTPPEEIMPAPLPLEELEPEILEPIAPQSVLSEPLPEINIVEEEIAEPAIQIKVLDDDIETEMQVDEAIENAIDMGEINADGTTQEIITIELEDEIEVITIELEDEVLEGEIAVTTTEVVETVKEIEITEKPVEVVIDVKEESPAPQQSTSLSINPYPLKESTEVTPKTETTITLPADSDKNLDDLTAEDVNITITTPEKIFWNETETFDVIEGFGTDMALALALRQIVPAQYAFSFGKGINPGEVISWTGGQPWNSVLEAALAPLNVTFKLEGKTILIRSVKTESAPAANETPSVEDANTSTSNSVEEIIDEVITSEKEETLETKVIIIENVAADHEQSAQISTPAQDIETNTLQEIVEKTIEATAIEQPLDIVTPTKEAAIIKDVTEPVEPILKTENTVDPVSIKRNNIQDPGQIETKQPIPVEQPKVTELLEEKKNEIVLTTAEGELARIPSKMETIDYTKEALKQASVQEGELRALDASTEISNVIQTEETTPDSQTAEEAVQTVHIVQEEIIALDVPVIIAQEPTDMASTDNEATIESGTNTITLDEIMPAQQAHAQMSQDTTTTSSLRVAPSNTIEIWEANRKSNLRTILNKWSAQENIELVWDASENYTLDKDIFISGTFKNAIDILFSKGLNASPKYALAQTPSYSLRIED
ncbi:MAG: hypothetical protein COA45_06110 [Zetaproteobacteria bacterium]|nr:MAG: hypothetical protein COA45_06110 [Zetaproteobacteria bacterium]